MTEREREEIKEREERREERAVTGRTANEIREFMNDYLNRPYTSSIPDLIAQSEDSSYDNAIRVESIMYHEMYKKTGRTPEEIRQFMLNEGIGDSYRRYTRAYCTRSRFFSSYENAIEHYYRTKRTKR